jgi:hypothetical protein
MMLLERLRFPLIGWKRFSFRVIQIVGNGPETNLFRLIEYVLHDESFSRLSWSFDESISADWTMSYMIISSCWLDTVLWQVRNMIDWLIQALYIESSNWLDIVWYSGKSILIDRIGSIRTGHSSSLDLVLWLVYSDWLDELTNLFWLVGWDGICILVGRKVTWLCARWGRPRNEVNQPYVRLLAKQNWPQPCEASENIEKNPECRRLRK